MRRLRPFGATPIVVLCIAACGGASSKRAATEGTAHRSPEEAAPKAPIGPVATAARQPGALPIEAEACDPPTANLEGLATASAPLGEPAEYTALKARLRQGESGAKALKSVQTLSHKYPQNAEISYLLGQLYLEKLWVDDGLKAFRHALQIDPELRSNPYLIRSVITGLGNDGDARQVRKFLAREIGAPATPYLQEVLFGDWRQQVKERAKEVLQDIP